MKRIVLLLGLMWISVASMAQTGKDTARNLKYEPASPLLGPDSGAYNNQIYRNSIKNAEYQNRGAEDRRNPNSADPNAQPNKQVPAKPGNAREK
ncbi:hypothetical protein [Taibaiella koreensis]|uniref:hypothetical protein n=1 Tax=Taibaiella koreensis TaxID=1268548 RepID=UPI000E59BDEE|nr:hypothetical protein [Taibaiella koreensis]